MFFTSHVCGLMLWLIITSYTSSGPSNIVMKQSKLLALILSSVKNPVTYFMQHYIMGCLHLHQTSVILMLQLILYHCLYTIIPLYHPPHTHFLVSSLTQTQWDDPVSVRLHNTMRATLRENVILCDSVCRLHTLFSAVYDGPRICSDQVSACGILINYMMASHWLWNILRNIIVLYVFH